VLKYGIDMGKVVAPSNGHHAHVQNTRPSAGKNPEPHHVHPQQRHHLPGYGARTAASACATTSRLPLDDLSNAAAEAVAHNVKGALAIPHPYGRLHSAPDLDLHFRTLIGAGCNPNVAASS
jgi:hypothetical protein